MTVEINNIVILGGGSAGWLTANYLASSHGQTSNQSGSHKKNITLIESPNIPVIGVGEGTWPSMRNTLNHIGIPETQFLKTCNASFKQGSKFVGWRFNKASNSNTSQRKGYYYHPFSVPPGYTQTDLYQQWQTHYSQQPFDYTFCPQPTLCDEYRAPKQVTTPDYAYVTNYGYHFDAGKLTALLTEHGTKRLGIRHIQDEVVEVQNHNNGDIKALLTQNNGAIEGDLFIDCSGMRSRLLHQHYHIGWKSVKHVLKNDAAIAIQVPYSEQNAAIESTTIATAQEHGWTWDIGLYHRRGMGYSYSSAHIEKDKAEAQLRRFISTTCDEKQVEQLDSRHIQFEPGYRDRFWHKNCVAIGMSAGFIEPLEASALAMVELSLMMLSDELPQNRQHMEIVSKRFNNRFGYRWSRVIDFLKLHYVLSERTDSDYWLDQRSKETTPESLQELIALWQYQSPSRYDFPENEEIFSSPSYQYVLYGMGFQTHRKHPAAQQNVQELVKNNLHNQQKFLAGLPTNRDYLTAIHQSNSRNVSITNPAIQKSPV